MKEKVLSQVTKEYYVPSETVRIVNGLQAAAYLAHGAKILDIYSSRDFKTNKPIIVYLFGRKDTTELYDAWCKHELN